METLSIMTTLSIGGFIWTCELIATANMAYQSGRIAQRVYNSSRKKLSEIIQKIKHYGGSRNEPNWVILDPNKPEGWEGSEEAFPIHVINEIDDDDEEEENEKKVVVDVSFFSAQPNQPNLPKLNNLHHCPDYCSDSPQRCHPPHC